MRINRNNVDKPQVYSQTRQRHLLLELIREANGHIDAKGLFRRAADRDQSISAATVYRSLNLFKQLGLVDEKRLGQARCYYEMKHSQQHQHLVCSRCGRVIDFECPLGEMVSRVEREHCFTVTKAEVYLEGYCAECSREKEAGKDGQ
jgi:Fur family transcriptional regulator, ferric uptake regulator